MFELPLNVQSLGQEHERVPGQALRHQDTPKSRTEPREKHK